MPQRQLQLSSAHAILFMVMASGLALLMISVAWQKMNQISEILGTPLFVARKTILQRPLQISQKTQKISISDWSVYENVRQDFQISHPPMFKIHEDERLYPAIPDSLKAVVLERSIRLQDGLHPDAEIRISVLPRPLEQEVKEFQKDRGRFYASASYKSASIGGKSGYVLSAHGEGSYRWFIFAERDNISSFFMIMHAVQAVQHGEHSEKFLDEQLGFSGITELFDKMLLSFKVL